MARKWDRLEEMVKKHDWNIFAAGEDTSGNDGTLLAEIRDLRRYLLLIEAEILHGKSQS
jgi:glycerol-3-phosphate cytidylyltransferase-like family protein